jgi:predicted dehydrogenase/threonine dehydrogenase-like Zn-dependent dehydrogenase
MEQLTQNLKSGLMQILEVPYPMLGNGCVLVRNHFSLISAGTEGKTVKDARLGYIGKAMTRKEEVKKVIRIAKTLGISETYKLMMNKLDVPSSLGYSCAGEVIAVASDITEFKVGDKVSCSGPGAVHAEVVAIPKNLCVKLPSGVSYNEGAFTTLGAIALQGIRQADLRLGENCVVIGLGLIGQLTLQMLNAAGIHAIGIDINAKMIALSKEPGVSTILDRNTEGLENVVRELTNGEGTDAVIITAATNDSDPVDLAGELCRKKGKVIIVGNVSTDFKRANYFKKELDLRMSCSYGPGRYDLQYEENGIDYPYAYVRWTEKRNMQAFVELIRMKKVDLQKLTSHIFDFKDAAKAYQLILDRSEPFTGILLKYESEKKLSPRIEFRQANNKAAEPKIGLIGAGAFANNVLLPALKGNCEFVGVATNKANNSRNVADKYGFAYCTNSVSELMGDVKINTIIIATRHDSHAGFVLEALQNKKNVFVEKPLCLNEEELTAIKEAHERSGSILMAGFNRRFAAPVQKAKKLFSDLDTPVSINYRINAGTIPAGHWMHDPKIGGGRIIGEVCHFIDLVSFLAGSVIKTISANALKNSSELEDTLNINLGFENGSIANISYFSNGSKELTKEYLEIFGSGQVVIINDFKSVTTYGKQVKTDNSSSQDKGHKREIKDFLNAVKKGQHSPIPFSEIYNSMLATFKAQESVKQGGVQIIL